MSTAGAIAIVVGFVAAFVGVWLLIRHLQKKRTEAFQAEAQRLGLDFADTGGSLDEPGFRVFDERGYRRRARNLMSGTYAGLEVRVADYSYRTRSGGRGTRVSIGGFSVGSGSRADSDRKRTSTTHEQTVFVLKHPTMAIPQFFLRKENALLNFASNLLGGQDIDFPEDEAFSKAFILRGDIEHATRAAFGAPVREALMRHKGRRIQLEGAGNTLVLHFGDTIPPADVKPRLDDMAALCEAFIAVRAAQGIDDSEGAAAP